MYGKDAYILTNIFKYKLKEDENIVKCEFPLKTINIVLSKLENKKLNYIIVDSRDNYNINEKMDFKNLNTYSSEYENSKIYISNQIRIDNINNYFTKNIEKETVEIFKILRNFDTSIISKVR